MLFKNTFKKQAVSRCAQSTVEIHANPSAFFPFFWHSGFIFLATQVCRKVGGRSEVPFIQHTLSPVIFSQGFFWKGWKSPITRPNNSGPTTTCVWGYQDNKTLHHTNSASLLTIKFKHYTRMFFGLALAQRLEKFIRMNQITGSSWCLLLNPTQRTELCEVPSNKVSFYLFHCLREQTTFFFVQL